MAVNLRLRSRKLPDREVSMEAVRACGSAQFTKKRTPMRTLIRLIALLAAKLPFNCPFLRLSFLLISWSSFSQLLLFNTEIHKRNIFRKLKKKLHLVIIFSNRTKTRFRWCTFYRDFVKGKQFVLDIRWYWQSCECTLWEEKSVKRATRLAVKIRLRTKKRKLRLDRKLSLWILPIVNQSRNRYKSCYEFCTRTQVTYRGF